MAARVVADNHRAPVEIPGYRLLDAIGEGGMGTVYRAVQLSLQRTVAIKLLKAAPGQLSGVALHRESRLMAPLAHRNLVTVFDCGQVGEQYYIVTELVSGSTLRQLMLPEKPWPIARARVVLDRIARALSYIHGKGLLHLDLKPENILCGEDGEPKITDFGLARVQAEASAGPELALYCGTPDYGAPEQRFGLPTSERSDLFSLAVMAYEFLTGHVPGRVYRSALELNPSLPAAVDRVLRRGLARSPEDRYASVEDFRRDLLGALCGEASPRRRRLTIAGVLVVMVGTFALALTGRPPAPHAIAHPPANPEPKCWIIHDHADQLRWFDLERLDWCSPHPLLAADRVPTGPGSPPLPVWPSQRPVLVITTQDNLGFVHPLSDATFARRVLGGWAGLCRAPPALAEENFCQAGSFDRECLTYDNLDDSRPWRIIDPAIQQNGDRLEVADPPDRPGDPALSLVREDALHQVREFGCYQWLSRIPERAGTIVVMRYRARAEEGSGRVAIRVELPVLLPAGARDDAVLRLRSVSKPFPPLAHADNEEPRQYRLENWVTPGAEWRTYYTIWEWPAYCRDPGYRNLVVLYAGIGKIWLDEVEVFTWEPGGAP